MSLYGSILWYMSGKYIEKFVVTWGKCLFLPYETYDRYLPCIVNDLPVEIKNSEHNLLQICSRLVLNGCNSVMCKNLNHIWSKYNVLQYIKVYTSLQSELSSIGQQLNEDQLFIVSHIKDFLNMREYNNPQFSINDEMKTLPATRDFKLRYSVTLM